jgi:lipid-A-disaccharide synthase
MPRLRIFMVAGEASSDAHGAGLVRALRDEGLDGTFYGVGGPQLQDAGMEMLATYDDLAVVGLWEAVRVVPRALRLLARLRGELRRKPPDLFLPIDSPEINLRLCKTAGAAGVPVVYFIAPQLWAWRASRVRTLRRFVRELLVLFPFETEWFRERGVTTTYVGHPLVDAARAHAEAAEAPVATGVRRGLLLPGSRASEVRHHLPTMAQAVQRLSAKQPQLTWTLRMADRLDADAYRPWAEQAGIALSREPVFDLADTAAIAVAASGTASFEVALMGVPTAVIYRVSRLTWWVARRMVSVPWVSMANLSAGRQILPELLQDDCNPQRLAGEIGRILEDAPARARMRAELVTLRERFGPRGAYERAAKRVLAHLRPGATASEGEGTQ